MVKIINAVKRQNKEGNSFMILVLQGCVELIQSKSNGKFYCTAKTCTVTSTFSEEVAKSLVGTEMKGTVARIESEPYPYILKETGEQIMLTHTYTYLPEEGEAKGEKQSVAVAV